MIDRIRTCIASGGPLPFDRYMELCLYDPEGGFFSAGDVRPGVDGDFVTSPEISPWFGRLIARWVDGVATEDTVLVELGAGSGSLLAPLLDEVETDVANVYATERSAAARSELRHLMPSVGVVESLDEVPDALHVVVIANEVFDNFPARLVERSAGEWLEVRVGVDGDALTLVRIPAGEELASWCDQYLGEVRDGAILAAQVGMVEWIEGLFDRFPSGALLVVDYGARTDDLATRHGDEVVRTFHRQRAGFDFLDAPGAVDVTVEVNVDVVRRALAGVRIEVLDQATFLRGLGADEVIGRLMDRSHEHARAGDVMAQLTARSDATGVRALLDLRGLGGFVVVQSEWGT